MLARRSQIPARFEQLVIDAFHARREHEMFACRAIVAAVSTMVTARVITRDIDAIRALRCPLVELVGAVNLGSGATRVEDAT